MTLHETIVKLTKYQNWRTGALSKWDKKDTVPPGEVVTDIVHSALKYLKEMEMEHNLCLIKNQRAVSNTSKVLNPKSPSKSKKPSSRSKPRRM